MKEILVVDDDDGTLDTIAELLREAGYRPARATTGQEALARMRISCPDLLLFDLFMPGMDGWQLLAEVREDDKLGRLPAVAMTAWPRPVELPQGIALLRKPFEWDALLRVVRRHCGDVMAKCRHVLSVEADELPVKIARHAPASP